MPIATRTFRVFVSSTFEDLIEERNALQRDVFPALSRLCETHGARFQAIDLRWGIRDEAVLGQQLMEICLAEIERCQRTGIKPNFIVLLGDRYGRQPLPARIHAREYETVISQISAGDRTLVESWYQRDDNAVPAEYLLKPRTGELVHADQWTEVEHPLREALREAARAARLSNDALLKYVGSATHQEIVKGLGRRPEDRKHVFAFFRTREQADEPPELCDLKKFLREQLNESIFEYDAGDVAKLCRDVTENLAKVILDEVARFESRTLLDLEIEAHDTFAKDRCRNFVGRESVLNAIGEYLASDDRRPLVIYGESGSGKSAIMAEAASHRGAVMRFLGVTARSSNGIGVLQTLCQEIARRYHQSEEIAATFDDLATAFADHLKLATPTHQLLLFIDAIDQMEAQDPAAVMNWLPLELPVNCKIIVSTSATPEALQHARLCSIDPFPIDDAKRALNLWLGEVRRTLVPSQFQVVLSHSRRYALPLYLKLAFEEARRWRSFDDLDQCVLGEGLGGAISRLIDRLSERTNHGSILVSRTLGYLTAARQGLSEDEIIDVLSADDEVWTDFVTRARHAPPERRLPGALWARLFLDLEPYLNERVAPGGSVMSFFHTQIRLQSGWSADRMPHRLLAHYFNRQVVAAREQGGDSSLRSLDELVYQLIHANMRQEAYLWLTDYRFVEQKVAALGPSSVVEDISMSLSLRISAPQHLGDVNSNVLQKLQQMLLRTSLQLEKYPNNLRTLLHGYFTDCVEPGISKLLLESKQNANEPWLRPLLPSLRRADGSRKLTVRRGTLPVRAVRIASLRGRPCVVTANDVVSATELETGKNVFPPVTNPSGYTWSIDSLEDENGEALLFLGGEDGRIRILNLASGTEALPPWWDTDQYRNINQVTHLTAARRGNNGAILVFTSAGRIWDVQNQREFRSGVGMGPAKFISTSKHGLVLAGHCAGRTFVESVDGEKTYRQAGRGKTIDGQSWSAPEASEVCTTVGTLPYRDERPFVAISYGDGTISVLDAITNNELFAPISSGSEPTVARCLDTCATSRGSAFLAAGFDSGAVKVWDLANLELLWDFNHDRRPVFSLAVANLSGDRLVIATGGEEATHVFELAADSGNVILRAEDYADSMDLTTTHDRLPLLAIAAQNGTIEFFDSQSGYPVNSWRRGRRVGINTLRFYQDPMSQDPLLLVGDYESIRFWSTKTQRELYPPVKHGNDWITSFCPYTDPSTGKSIVCLGYYSGSLEFRYFTGELVHEPVRVHRMGINSIACAKLPETVTSIIVTASTDCTVRAFDPSTFTEISSPLVHYGYPSRLAVAWCPKAQAWLLGVTCTDNTVYLWHLPSGKRHCRPLYHARPACDIAILPTSNGFCYVLTVGTDGLAKLWSQDGELVQTVPFPGQVICCRASQNLACFGVLETMGQAHLFGVEGESLNKHRRSPSHEDTRLEVIARGWVGAHRTDDGMDLKHVGDQYADSVRCIAPGPGPDKVVSVGLISPVVRIWEGELYKEFELTLGTSSPVTAVASCQGKDKEMVFGRPRRCFNRDR